MLVRGFAHGPRAIGASADRRDFAPPNHPDVSVSDIGFPWARS